ncbi:hypothetical protein ACLKA7_007821 [Drosophila subpalustris]
MPLCLQWTSETTRNEAESVHDYIDSTNSEDEAIEVASKVRLIHQEGGFEIRNWASNSASVLMQLKDIKTATKSPVQFGGTEKFLDLHGIGKRFHPNQRSGLKGPHVDL